MAKDLGIPAAAVFDGDHADTRNKVALQFPSCIVEILPVDDMRDKPKRDQFGKETNEIEKKGIFDRRGVIKPAYVPYLRGLFDRLIQSLKS